ncbi:hypothetical protein OGAPHI_005768 [Ogataea philodendri]|uniref:Uncharacterized protein n=1 Tax=Ogataea philodendri TaxID=1378263 RepID=A0A9P8P086_9ASCO|nr:uncharacterized protein OGAPHI_005768 [Ogataea philodendri]KAH3662516.1 hypothetical protein OGAPHI_005768 [Ogataea philodendri]
MAADANIGFIVILNGMIKNPIAIGSITRLYTTASTKLVLMLRKVFCEMSSAPNTPAVPSWRPKSFSCTSSAASGCADESITTSAASIAMSVPDAMAMPRSAWIRAGASLMPSPTNATFRPRCCIWSTTRSLSSGLACAKTLLNGIPTARDTVRAVLALSPVTIDTV